MRFLKKIYKNNKHYLVNEGKKFLWILKICGKGGGSETRFSTRRHLWTAPKYNVIS